MPVRFMVPVREPARGILTLTLSRPTGEGERLLASLPYEGAGLKLCVYGFPLPSDGRGRG